MPPPALTRSIALAGAVAIHIVMGLALFTMSRDGEGGALASQGADETAIGVQLVSRYADAAGPSSAPSSGGPGVARIDEGLTEGGRPGASGADTAAHTPVPAATGETTSRGRLITTRTAPKGAETLSGAETQMFRNRLLAHIEQYKRYPPAAQRAAVEGVTRIHFVMDRDGSIVEAWVETSSGSPLLDEEALAAIRRAAPLPTPPPSWPAVIDVTLPIGYGLQ